MEINFKDKEVISFIFQIVLVYACVHACDVTSW